MRPRVVVSPMAEFLLRRVLPAAVRDEMLADLADLAATHANPRRWYLRQTLRVLWPPTLIGLYRETSDADGPWQLPDDVQGSSAVNLVEGFLIDLRRAMRSLRRRPTYAVTAVVTLAIGIGSTTAMFSVAHGVALRPLSFARADRLFTICERAATIPVGACVVSPPNAADMKERIPDIEFLGIGRRWDAKHGTGDEAEFVSTAVVTPDVFRAFELRPQAGRLLDERDLIGAPGVVAVISDEFRRTRLGAGDVIGQSMVLDGSPVTIVGVLPPMEDLPKLGQVHVWRPLHVDPRDETHRSWTGFHAYGRVRGGQEPGNLAARFAPVIATLRTSHFSDRAGWNVEILSLTDAVLGQSRRLLGLFLGAVGLVLLVACANVANLMLEQATARQREWGMRTALGASAERLVTLQLTESFVLAFAGTLGGLILAVAGVKWFTLHAPGTLPRIDDVAVNGPALAFALLTATIVALFFGAAPAWRVARLDVSRVLQGGGRTVSARRSRLSSVLVAAQIAVALTLLGGATLLARSFTTLASWNPGFAADRIMTFSLAASRDRYPDRARIADLWKTVEEELRAVPGVEAVATTSAGPMFGGGDGAIELQVDGTGMPRPASWFNTGPGYFATLGIPILRGREVSEADHSGAAPVAVVNEAFARRYLGDRDPVGRRVVDPRAPSDGWTIIGVVRDIPPFAPGPVEPEIYWSARQEPRLFMYVVLRVAKSDTELLLAAVRERLRHVGRELRPGSLQSVHEIQRGALRRPLFNALLLSSFAATVLVLTGVGTYALLAYVVRRRDREMGVRLALGAVPSQVGSLVLRDALRIALPGLALGLFGAWGATRLLQSLSAGVEVGDPATLVVATVVVSLVAVLAAVLPAWRAAHVPPATIMRGD